MKTIRLSLLTLLLLQALLPALGQPPSSAIEKKYTAPLAKIFALQPQIAPLNPVFKKVYPVAIVEDKTFYIFEPAPEEKAYRLVHTAPDPYNIPQQVRAAMPLGFWGNRTACVVSGEVFDQPDGYVLIFHEFVHCAQAECCEQKLKEKLSIYKSAMKTQDYMWELQYPFPYTDAAFVRMYTSLLSGLDRQDASQAEALRNELKKSLRPADWEYMTWQEWKEGLARYLENRIRRTLGLAENIGGEEKPYSRVTFYRGGDALIRLLERQHPGITANMEELYRMISLSPENNPPPAPGAVPAHRRVR
jgi:hypothetical protein